MPPNAPVESVIDDRHPYDIALEELQAELAGEQAVNPRAALQAPDARIAPRATGGMPVGTNFVPPLPKPTGELRTTTTPLGDRMPYALAPAVSSIDRGLDAVAQVGGEGNQMMRDMAYEYTGIPAAQRGGRNLAEAGATGDLPRAAGAIGQMVLAAAPMKMPSGRLVDDIAVNAGRYVGVPMAANMSLNPTAQAADAAPVGNLTQMLETQSQLRDQTEAARVRRENFRPKNGRAPDARDVQYDEANREFNALSRRLDAISTQVADEQKKNSPEFQLEMQRKRREADDTARAKRAATPTREMFSDVMPWLYPITAGAAMTLGGSAFARATGNYNKMITDIGSRWQGAVERARSAAPQSIARREAVMEAQGLNTMYEDAVKAGAGAWGAAAKTGAKVGVLGAFAPEEVDFARASAGSPLWDSLKTTMIDDWPSTLKRAGMAAGLGALSGTTGAVPPYVFGSRANPPNFGPETRALTATTPEPRIPSRAAAKRLPAAEQPEPRPVALQAQDAPRLPPPETPAQPKPRARGKASQTPSADNVPEGHTYVAKGKGSKIQKNGRFATMPDKQQTQMDDTKPMGGGRRARASEEE